MSRRAVIALGIGQCINWGVLYYAFAVLLLPVEAELATGRWVVTGAFSLALLFSAIAAPIVGRWSDRDQGARVMRVGGNAAAGFLALWALFPAVWVMYVVWAGLGLCMAATLYEPAFALISHAHEEPAARLRALATVTLIGGLASTVFLPLTDALVRAGGWRIAVAVLAMLLVASTGMVGRIAVAQTAPAPRQTPVTGATPTREGPGGPNLPFLLLAFGFASLSSAAVIGNLVPALGERAVARSSAALCGGLFGPLQLLGRALMVQGRLSASPYLLLASSLGLQALGLTAWALTPSAVAASVGIAVFAIGSGLITLVRPYLAHTLFAAHGAGYLNGRLAQSQQLARAAGPVVAGWAVTGVSYSALFGLLGAGFAGLTIASVLQAQAGIMEGCSIDPATRRRR